MSRERVRDVSAWLRLTFGIKSVRMTDEVATMSWERHPVTEISAVVFHDKLVRRACARAIISNSDT